MNIRHNRTARGLLAAAAVIAALAVSGCSEAASGTVRVGDELTERTATLTDGRKVTCLTWKRMNAGGMSCDWAGAKR